MKNTIELVTSYRDANGGSARKAGPTLGVSTAVFAEWVSGKELPSEERVEEMARALGVDGQLALVLLRRDRAKSDGVRRIWQRIAEGLAVMVLSATPFMAPSDARAGFNNNFSAVSIGPEYTLRRKQRRRSWLDVLGGRP